MPFSLEFTPKNPNIYKDSLEAKNLPGVILNIPTIPNTGATLQITANSNGQIKLIKLEIRGITVLDQESSAMLDAVVTKGLLASDMPFYLSGRTQFAPIIGEVVFRHERLKPVKSKNACDISHLKLDVPSEFCCPLSGDIMDNPVYDIRSDGIKYDEDFLMYWINKSTPKLMPHTKLPFKKYFLKTDYSLKAKIYAYIQSNLECSEKESLDKALLKYGAEPTTDKIVFSRALLTLVEKAEDDFPEELSIFLKAGMDVNIQDADPVKRQTALHIALSKRNIGLAIELIYSGAKINIENASRITAFDIIKTYPISEDRKKLIWICQNLKLLSINEDTISLTSERKIPSPLLRINDNEEKIPGRLTQNFGSPVTATGDAYLSLTRQLDILLEKDRNPSDFTPFKQSIAERKFDQALRRISNFGDIDRAMPILNILLTFKAPLNFDINAVAGETRYAPIHYAARKIAEHGNRCVYDLLVKYGADENMHDAMGKSAKQHLDESLTKASRAKFR